MSEFYVQVCTNLRDFINHQRNKIYDEAACRYGYCKNAAMMEQRTRLRRNTQSP